MAIAGAGGRLINSLNVAFMVDQLVVRLTGVAVGIVIALQAVRRAFIASEGGSIEVKIVLFALITNSKVVAHVTTDLAGLAS